MDNVNLMVLGCQASQAHPYCARNTPASVSVGRYGVYSVRAFPNRGFFSESLKARFSR